MRILPLLLILAGVVSCHPADKDGIDHPGAAHAKLPELTAAQASEYAAYLQLAWKDSLTTALDAAFKNKVLVHGKYTMKLDWTVYGNAPADGRSLYISLHGGGGTTADVNDQQWENQKQLYKPSEGVYLCPRAITNTWDLHFRPESDGFYEEIIRMAVAFLDVNPDKVYLMGYSAGGDGVWRLAPRMADHWAAASMMAGHPGDVSLLSLRNLPFMIWCGENDSAYDRNTECGLRIVELAALHAADPGGYIHEGHIVPGKGHWMDLVDAAAVPWMAKYKRNPLPDKVVWCQGDEPKTNFYWLGVPASEAKKGKVLSAELEGNTVRILSSAYTYVTIHLNDAMMDLDKPVKVVWGDRTLYEGTVTRKPEVLRQSLREREDPSYLFPARIVVKL